MSVSMSATNSHGIYYLDDQEKAYAVCWIKNRDQSGAHSPGPWIFLLTPLFITYSYAIYISNCAKEMLDPTSPNSKHSGLLKTHFHRLFALDSNTRTINLYVGYWIFLFISTLLAFFTTQSSHFGFSSKPISTALMNLVLLCLGAKGYVDLIVFSSILLSRSYKVCATSDSENGDPDYFHLNKGLKLQLMTFVTRGLKQSTTEELAPCKEKDNSRNNDTNGGSRMWTIKVKSPSEQTSANLSLGVLTNQQYREYLEEMDPVQVETVVLGNRESHAHHSGDFIESPLEKYFLFTRSSAGSEALLDIEIPSRRTLNDQPELSPTAAASQEKGNLLQKFLR